MYRHSIISMLILILACTHPPTSDLVIYGNIYTMDVEIPHAEALVIRDKKICFVGTREDASPWVNDQTIIHEYHTGIIIPGFIEGHGHFEGLGKSQVELNLLNEPSWEAILTKTRKYLENNDMQWVIGRGWHQDKWDSLATPNYMGYPYHTDLSALCPQRPVILIHASGHSLLANEKAMEWVGLSEESANPIGGRIVKDPAGQWVGIFEETAMQPFKDAYNEWLTNLPQAKQDSLDQIYLEMAQNACLRNGVTSFQDAGSKFGQLQFYLNEANNGQLKVRLWAMLRDSLRQMRQVVDQLPMYDKDGYFSCRAIKSEIDGALGSYGAWLLKPYFDAPGLEGQNTTSIKDLSQIADLCAEHNLQLCVHAIGDRGNRTVLDMMEAKTKDLHDHRWRIEHAQHLHPADISRFAQLGIIASMQSVHCTSDAAFVEKRLGRERAKNGAYVWRSLLNSGAVVSNGTDTPVEKIDPIANFYAAVTRKPMGMDSAFFPNQKLTREEALYSMTMAPAFAAFEDTVKGSLTKGKWADLTVLSQNILTCPEDTILSTHIKGTYVGGRLLYSNEE